MLSPEPDVRADWTGADMAGIVNAAWPKYIFLRGRQLWINVRCAPNRWQLQPSGFSVDDDPDGSLAARHRSSVQEQLDASQDFRSKTGKPDTVQGYGEALIPRRAEQGVRSWKDDEARLVKHVYPMLGAMFVRDVRARHINEMVQAARLKKLAPKTVWNIYGITQALFRAAEIDGLVDRNPCVLTEYELGKLGDKDPHWRRQAIYTLDEYMALLCDHRVPQDRQVLYGLQGLARLRHGEAAGLRWKHVEADRPLNRIVVATSYDTGQTKTKVHRWMPVHPVLAAMLAEWKLTGWPREFERKPADDDLVVPHTRPHNKGPRVKWGGMRADGDSWKRLQADLKALGYRARRGHDLCRTGVTLYREAGAGAPGFDRDILHACTHGDEKSDVLDMYTTWGWQRLCDQILPLKLTRSAAVVGGPLQ